MTQTNLGTALTRLGERESGTARLEEAVAAYRAALELYKLEALSPQWEETQVSLIRVFERLGDGRGMVSVIEELLRRAPDREELYIVAWTLYHEVLFDFAAAHRVIGIWLERQPEDLGAQCRYAESHLTTGRFSEAAHQLAKIIGAGQLPIETNAALQLLEIASLLALGRRNAAGPELNALHALMEAQAPDFAIGWTFAGTTHFIAEAPALANHREILLEIIRAMEGGERRAVLAAIETARVTLSTGA
jgi:tetratricopeptide (TPR) repeat protein